MWAVLDLFLPISEGPNIKILQGSLACVHNIGFDRLSLACVDSLSALAFTGNLFSQVTEKQKSWPYGWIELLYFQYFVTRPDFFSNTLQKKNGTMYSQKLIRSWKPLWVSGTVVAVSVVNFCQI